MTRPLYEIAQEIRADWAPRTRDKRVPVYADAYLRPMETLTHITDNYHADSADHVVRYFLSNATTWRGDVAKRIKLELKGMLNAN